LCYFGAEVAADKETALQPPEEYVLNISQIALTPEAQGIGSKNGLKKTIEPTVVQVSGKDINGVDVVSTVCTLDHTCRQTSCSLTFGWDEEITFSLAKGGGKGPVSITGFLQPSPDEEDEMNGFPGDDDDDDDDDEDDDDEGQSGAFFAPRGEGQGDDDSDDDDDDDEEDDDSDDDDSEDDDEGAPMLVQSSSKRKQSFDLDNDAVEARSHNTNQTSSTKKKAKSEVAQAQKEALMNESDDDDSDDNDDDTEEEIDAKDTTKQEANDNDDDDDDDKEEEEDDEDDEDSNDDEDEELSPEDEYVKLLSEAIIAKGGEAVPSSLGNVAKPQGLPKQKLSNFLKSRKEFIVENFKVRLA
jgi:hypothetical protein